LCDGIPNAVLLYHLVFSTRGRYALIRESRAERLNEYLSSHPFRVGSHCKLDTGGVAKHAPPSATYLERLRRAVSSPKWKMEDERWKMENAFLLTPLPLTPLPPSLLRLHLCRFTPVVEVTWHLDRLCYVECKEREHSDCQGFSVIDMAPGNF